MTILLIGAHGQLGTALRAVLATLPASLVMASRRGPVDLAGARPLDLFDGDALDRVLTDVDPAIIINAAAWTDVDAAEHQETSATLINAAAVERLGSWAASRGALVVHVSTDYVFDGTAIAPYREEDRTAPLNAYGRSKLAGEFALSSSGARHMIFRTAWLYSATGKSFFSTILRLARERDRLQIVADQHGTPTSAAMVADAICHAIADWMLASQHRRAGLQGTYHLTADGATTWYGFAEAIAEEAFRRRLIDNKPDIVPISSSEYPTPARRPRYSVMDTARYKKTFLRELKPWRLLLQETLDDLQRTIGSE